MYINKKELSHINGIFFISKDALDLWNKRIKTPVFYLSFIYKQDQGHYKGQLLKCDIKTFC